MKNLLIVFFAIILFGCQQAPPVKEPDLDWEYQAKTFIPWYDMDAYECPSEDCPVVRAIVAGTNLQTYATAASYPKEAWLCIETGEDVFCKTFVAFIVDGKQMGLLISKPGR